MQDHWPYVAVDRAPASTLDEWLAAHPEADAGRGGGLDRARLLPAWRSRTTPASPTSICSCTRVLVNERGQVAVMALGVGRDGASTAGRAAASTAARCRWTRSRCARSAAPPSATCSPAACCCTTCWPAQPALDEPDTALGDRPDGAARPRIRAPAVDHAAADSRGAARDRQPQHRRPGAPALPQRPHLAAARSTAGATPQSRRTAAARSRCCSTGCAASATCRRCRASAARVARVAAMESQRTDEIATQVLRRPGAQLRAAAHDQHRAGPGHAGRRATGRC